MFVMNGFCYLGVVPVRSNHQSRSEQITQLLFGDRVKVLEQFSGDNVVADSWLKIQNINDNYIGWVDKRNLLLSDTLLPEPNYIISSTIAKIQMDNDIITIPMASMLADKMFSIEGHKFSLVEGSVIAYNKRSPLLIKAISLLLLNTPYQWGGKSIFGMDCSGFVQNVFSFAAVDLLRDASMQARQGKDVAFNECAAGDLVFFDNPQTKNINHVGIYLGNNKVIHCSGKVRIDNIDEKGIKPIGFEDIYSHHLCAVKRFF